MKAAEPISIRAVRDDDADAIARIYNHFVTDTIVTFEEEPVTSAEMAARIAEVQSFSLPWLVAQDGGRVVGYAYATRWKARRGYRFSVEITVYLDPAAAGKKIGTQLYDKLFKLLREKSIHSAMGGIALPNPASVALHEKFGMRKVAHFEHAGIKFDRWIDVAYWQLLL